MIGIRQRQQMAGAQSQSGVASRCAASATALQKLHAVHSKIDRKLYFFLL